MYYQSISNDACYIWAIEAHEATNTATEIFKIRGILRNSPGYFVGVPENIAQIVKNNSFSGSFQGQRIQGCFSHSKVVTSYYELSTVFQSPKICNLYSLHLTQEWFKD